MAKIKKINKKKIQKIPGQQIIVDEKKNLKFDSQEELFKYFKTQIKTLEAEYRLLISGEKEVIPENPEIYLEATLDQPDEIWVDRTTLKNEDLFHFIKAFEEPSRTLYYLTTCYMDEDDSPTFIYLHFATFSSEVINHYKRDEIIFEKSLTNVLLATIEGDALIEGDKFSIDLFNAMLKIRMEKDISIESFLNFADFREETIENPDEIWRQQDSNDQILVTFIKSFPETEENKGEEFYYVAVTQEDPTSQSHALLFSFPTIDDSLVDRYRHGENLQAEEVVQESSH